MHAAFTCLARADGTGGAAQDAAARNLLMAHNNRKRRCRAHVTCLWMLLSLSLMPIFPGGVIEAAAQVTIDPARSLLVTDRDVIDSAPGGLFSLERVLNQLVSESRGPS